MARSLSSPSQNDYGFPQSYTTQFPTPVISSRDPTAQDVGYTLGQIWVNKTPAASVWILQAATSGVATWVTVGSTGSLFTNLTATNFLTNSATIGTTLSGDTWSATGANAAIDLNLTPKGIGGVNVTTGELTVATGDITATMGDIVATAGDLIALTSGNGLQIKEGVGTGRMGVGTLVLGTKAITIPSLTANTRVFVTRSALNASPALGFLQADTSVPGTLTVNSLDATAMAVVGDISSFFYLCVEAL